MQWNTELCMHIFEFLHSERKDDKLGPWGSTGKRMTIFWGELLLLISLPQLASLLSGEVLRRCVTNYIPTAAGNLLKGRLHTCNLLVSVSSVGMVRKDAFQAEQEMQCHWDLEHVLWLGPWHAGPPHLPSSSLALLSGGSHALPADTGPPCTAGAPFMFGAVTGEGRQAGVLHRKDQMHFCPVALKSLAQLKYDLNSLSPGSKKTSGGHFATFCSLLRVSCLTAVTTSFHKHCQFLCRMQVRHFIFFPV